MKERTHSDIVIIGGGQAALALGYWLQKRKREYVILDREQGPGGAWRHAWESLRLFSPAPWSSLPGWLFPGGVNSYPSRDALLDYISEYETRYQLPVRRPVEVKAVRRVRDEFDVETDSGDWHARVVVSATGTWSKPYIPDYPGRDAFEGLQLHSAHYRNPEPFEGKKVTIVGGANSGAQILAEVSRVAETLWVTEKPPAFLPDDVDGRVLFERATERWKAKQAGRDPGALPGGFGDVVMVPPVKEARERGVLKSVPPFERLAASGAIWPDGHRESFDAIIWCTGFRPALDHLSPLGLVRDGIIPTYGARAKKCPGLWLHGYGDWTGAASATLIGVGRISREVARQIDEYLA